MIHVLFLGTVLTERHTVFDAQGDDTLTVRLGVMREASACRASSVDSHTNCDENSRARKKKREKKKKKKNREIPQL